MGKQDKFRISSIFLINIGINIGCTIIIYSLLSLYHEIFISGEPWVLMWVMLIILGNIIGIILSIILSSKIILTIIIYFVFILDSIVAAKFNEYNIINLEITGIIFWNIISGVLVLLIINIHKKIKRQNGI